MYANQFWPWGKKVDHELVLCVGQKDRNHSAWTLRMFKNRAGVPIYQGTFSLPRKAFQPFLSTYLPRHPPICLHIHPSINLSSHSSLTDWLIHSLIPVNQHELKWKASKTKFDLAPPFSIRKDLFYMFNMGQSRRYSWEACQLRSISSSVNIFQKIVLG